MPSGPYLPTSAAYLKESSLLLQAYPVSTRITTKYTFPKATPCSKSQQQSSTQENVQAQPPAATLVLKTYTPEAGICLKYRTNKAAEVGRLITALGLLAGGADLTSLDSGAANGSGTAGDVEMGGEEGLTAAAAATTGASPGIGTGAGGKGKSKKKGKGKK
ncbi:signal recognition particle 9 kDa protein-domain-containing protein [Aspergillus aurantiobrunneus]